MTLAPEQIEEGWIEWNGGPCPIKDYRTVLRVQWSNGAQEQSSGWANRHYWTMDPPLHIIAYRIIEDHGADAEPARPTPFPASYDELVFDDAGWSQTIIVDGKRPEWLRDDDRYAIFTLGDATWTGDDFDGECAIRVRRREQKRETVQCQLSLTHDGRFFYGQRYGTIDLIDGKPDLSTLKIAEDAL